MSISQSIELSNRIDDLKDRASEIHQFTRFTCINSELLVTCGDRNQLHIDLNAVQRDELCALFMTWEGAMLTRRKNLIAEYQTIEDGNRQWDI